MGRFSTSVLVACSLAVASASPGFAQANNVFSYKAHISAKLPPNPKVPLAAEYIYGGTLLSDYKIDLDITGDQIVGASVTSAKRGAGTNVTVLPPTPFTPANTGDPTLTFQMPGILSGTVPGELANFYFSKDGKGQTYINGQNIKDPAYAGIFTIGLSPEITYTYDTLMFDFNGVDLADPNDFYRGRIYVNGSNIIGVEGTTGLAGDITGLFDGRYPGGNQALPYNQFFYDGSVFNINGFSFDTTSGNYVNLRRFGNSFGARSLTPGIGGQLDFKISYAGIFVPPTGGVPEPGTWALLILGFGAVGAARRRQRVTAALKAA